MFSRRRTFFMAHPEFPVPGSDTYTADSQQFSYFIPEPAKTALAGESFFAHNGDIASFEGAIFSMADPVVESPTVPIAPFAIEQPTPAEMSRIPARWQRWPEDKRPPLIKMPDGRLGISVLMTDGDGSFFPEDFTEEFVRAHPGQTTYEQRIRAADSLAIGSEVFSALRNTRVNEGVPIMNFITGRSCPEMRAIVRAMGDTDDESFIIGGDGSDFSPPKWMWKFIDENMEQIESVGFKKVALADGSSVLTYSEKGLHDINAMLTAFNLYRDAEYQLGAENSEATQPTPVPVTNEGNLPSIARAINEKIQHGDEQISWLSLLRGSSTYLVLENESDREELMKFATEQGIRAVQSPHVKEVVELHGAHTGKDTAFKGFTEFMEILLDDPEGNPHSGLSITFGGNGKNDVGAAEWLMAQKKSGRLHADVYFFPKVSDPTQYFVDKIPEGATPVDKPHAYGWMHSILPQYLATLRHNPITYDA